MVFCKWIWYELGVIKMIDVTINRDKYIGGSDLPTILGLNKVYNKSIIQFAREKLKLVYNSFDGNEYTEYGNIMEPKMRDYLNEIRRC